MHYHSLYQIGLRMPKCLDCGQTRQFWYDETSHKLGLYNDLGEMEDVETDWYDDVTNGHCGDCDSTNIEGKL
jgi:hypothetical protein